MAFAKKTWKARLVEFAGRRALKNVSTEETTIYDVTRNEGTVSQEGDAFSAANMNDLENRIESEFNNLNASGAITGYEVTEDGAYISYKNPSTGETVKKKLGKTDRHVIKENVGNGTISVSGKIPGYEKLTAEDFAFVVTSAVTSSSHRQSDYGYRAAYDPVASCAPGLKYDAPTGTITIYGCSGSNSESGPANSAENRGVGLTGTVYFYGDM